MNQPVFQRPNLWKEFGNICLYPLTMAIAGMGYGKTMASRAFLEENEHTYVWLSIGQNEMSLGTLWDSLVFQLRKTVPELSVIFSQVGFPSDPAQREQIVHVIGRHSYDIPTILVFDDYHYASMAELDLLVQQIVRADIENFHILLLSRTLPSFDLEELLLKDFCYCIEPHCFELNADEIASYFAFHHVSLTPKELELAYSLSEGWISALYLMLQHYLKTNEINAGMNIFRLIESSVLSSCTPEELELLQVCSLFDTISPKQAVFISKNPNAEDLLQAISHQITFVQYHEKDNFYRIHKLLAAYLQGYFEKSNSTTVLRTIFLRCGCWYLQEGMPITGLKYLLKGGDYDRILQEFSKPSINKILHNNSHFIKMLFQNIPLNKLQKFPMAYLTYIGFFITNIDPQEGRKLLVQADIYFQNHQDLDPSLKRQLQGELHLIHAYTLFNDIGAMAKKIQEAETFLASGSVIANKDKIVTLGCSISLYLYHKHPGQLATTMKLAQEAFSTYSKLAHGCGKGLDDLIFAEYLAEKGDFDKAALLAEKAYYKAATESQKDVMLNASFTHIRVLKAQGKHDESTQPLKNMQALGKETNNPILLSTYELSAAYISYQSNQLDLLPIWVQEDNLKNNSMSFEGPSFYYIVHGKYLLAQKKYLDLEINAEELLEACKPFEFILGYIHGYLMQAISQTYLYGTLVGKEPLHQCLSLASQDGIFLSLMEYGKELVVLLEHHFALGSIHASLEDYAQALLSKSLQYGSLTNAAPIHLNRPKELTQRELEILAHICLGHTNKFIAHNLYLAEVTVRKHVTSIYKKLGVNGRSSAVRKASELDLI